GAHWTALPQKAQWPVFSLQEPDALYAPGVMKSTDGGSHWFPLRYDLRFADVSQLVVAPDNSETVFALVNGEGVYKSADSALTWVRVSDGLDLDLGLLVVAPFEPWMLFAAGKDGVFRTSDGGASWQQVSSVAVDELVVDPKTTGTVYAVGRSEGILKSVDGGDSWTASAVWFEPPPGTFGVYESRDGGSTWMEFSEDPGSYPDPLHPDLVYAQSKVSFDGGSSWLTIAEVPGSDNPVFSRSLPRKAYVQGLYGDGVFSLALTQKTMYFPQIGAGRTADGEFQSELVFMNLGPESQVDLEFIGRDGQPMSLSLEGIGPQFDYSFTLGEGETVSLRHSLGIAFDYSEDGDRRSVEARVNLDLRHRQGDGQALRPRGGCADNDARPGSRRSIRSRRPGRSSRRRALRFRGRRSRRRGRHRGERSTSRRDEPAPEAVARTVPGRQHHSHGHASDRGAGSGAESSLRAFCRNALRSAGR
ncbi:MAG: hypothetical protein P8Y94_16360, partial [Acidobacteriota bacterium]